jgi:DNA replication and repair protein RecF
VPDASEEIRHARISRLSLRDFRNFERLELDVPADGLVLIGDNGQGKTNLLEAMYYLSLLRSNRGARDSDIVRFDASGFFVEAAVCGPEPHELAVGFERAGKRKKVRKDGAPLERLSDGLGVVPIVMFSPADVELVAGAPAARRRFLDIMLAFTSRPYLRSLQSYRGALERRNAALRELQRHPTRKTASIEVWEQPLAEHGAALVRTRRAWVTRVRPGFSERCASVGERLRVEIAYASSVDANAESVELAITNALAARRSADIRHGLTMVGPHRDDLVLQLGGRDLRAFGSAGQQRTAAIALRTIEAETLRDARGATPVFLLDDPFAELDVRRATRVLALLREIGLGQTVLAVPRDSDIPAELTTLLRRRVVAGQLEDAA